MNTSIISISIYSIIPINIINSSIFCFVNNSYMTISITFKDNNVTSYWRIRTILHFCL